MHSLTASEISRRTGIPKQSLSDWGNGVTPKNIANINLLANYFNIPMEELLFYDLSLGKNTDFFPSNISNENYIGSNFNDKIREKFLKAKEDLAMALAHNGMIKFCSEKFAALIGTSSFQLTGESFYSLINFEHVDSLFYSSMRRLESDKTRHFSLMTPILSVDGQTHLLEWDILKFVKFDSLIGIGDYSATKLPLMKHDHPQSTFEEPWSRLIKYFNTNFSDKGIVLKFGSRPATISTQNSATICQVILAFIIKLVNALPPSLIASEVITMTINIGFQSRSFDIRAVIPQSLEINTEALKFDFIETMLKRCQKKYKFDHHKGIVNFSII